MKRVDYNTFEIIDEELEHYGVTVSDLIEWANNIEPGNGQAFCKAPPDHPFTYAFDYAIKVCE